MSEKTVECRLLRDFWDDKGERHKKGTVVDMTIEAAMDGVEQGTLERVKKEKKAG